MTALWPYCDQYSAQTGEPPLTLGLSMITCQGTTQARKSKRACFDIGLSTSPYRPVHARHAKRAIAAVSLRLPPPPSRRSRTDWYGSFHGRARSCLTGDSPQPQPRRHHSNQFITEKNMCDDVSANKSLNGNERETPSIRSRLVRLVGDSL